MDIDVSKCKYYREHFIEYCDDKTVEIDKFCEMECVKCYKCVDCYYKQLQQLKAENEELYMKINALNTANSGINIANRELEQKIEKIRQVHQWILDQWELDTKEVQDKILQIIGDE